MTEQEFVSLISLGHELEGVEFKGRGKRTDRQFLAKVIRAMLGMANHRDGGLIIIGIPPVPSDEARFQKERDDLE